MTQSSGEPKKLVFEVDRKNFTLRDQLALEDMGANRERYHAMFALFSKYMVNEHGEHLTRDEALEILGDYTDEQLTTAMEQFVKSIKELQATTIPPASSGK